MWYERKKDPFRVIRKSYARFKKNGMKEVRTHLNREYYSLVPEASNNQEKRSTYSQWIRKNEKKIMKRDDLTFKPLISIITPAYNTEKKYLIAMIRSVLEQSYENWELCIADDASSSKDTLTVLKSYERKDERIKVLYRNTNGHICKASNSALSLAKGEYVLFLDHDDTLSHDALYIMVRRLNKNPALKLIYADEDKIDAQNRRFSPHFKSDWNPDMFFSQNYISHPTMIRRNIVDAVGGFRAGYEGSQDYDLILRCLPHITDKEIAHIPKILYHWRAIKGSTALASSEKKYTTDAGIKALKSYFTSVGRNVTVEKGMLENTYKVTYHIEQDLPLVSLLIPTRDGYEVLSKCIQSILDHTDYPNYEIIILDNETSDTRTLEYFEELRTFEHIRIVEYHHPFNYSAINNFGVTHAKGEVIALLNNDVEVISRHWLAEMVQHALRPEIGAVGAMLYYDNNTIQHAGVVLGIGGVAGHSHKYFPKGSFGYFSRLQIIQNYAAVTGACLVVRKALYEKVGGLDEKNLKVAFNDVDFCLKLQAKGYRNLWTPYVELYHHESISRGSDNTKEKQERFGREIMFMKQKWKNVLKNDRYYNKNLTLQFENFSLKKI